MRNLATAGIAYVVGASYRGQGLARRAVTRLVTHAYDDLGLRRTYLEIEADNGGSTSVARAAGFRPTKEIKRYLARELYQIITSNNLELAA